MTNTFLLLGNIISVSETKYTGNYALKIKLNVLHPITQSETIYTLYYPKASNQHHEALLNANYVAFKGYIDTNDVEIYLIVERCSIMSTKKGEDLNENL